MNRFLLAAALLLAAGSARAQNIGQATYIAPLPVRGQGTISVTATSAAINASISLAPNSAAFPVAAMNGTLTFKVQANATTGVYVCWLGGTCTSSVGEYIAPGESVTKLLDKTANNMTNSPPTAISTGTAAVVMEW